MEACFTASATTATCPCAHPVPGVPGFPARPVTVEPRMPSGYVVVFDKDTATLIFSSSKSGLVLSVLGQWGNCALILVLQALKDNDITEGGHTGRSQHLTHTYLLLRDANNVNLY